jgi:hypothetical protein
MKIQFDKTCNIEDVDGFMAWFEYQGDASIFTALGSNDAPQPNTNIHPLTSGTTNEHGDFLISFL